MGNSGGGFGYGYGASRDDLSDGDVESGGSSSSSSSGSSASSSSEEVPPWRIEMELTSSLRNGPHTRMDTNGSKKSISFRDQVSIIERDNSRAEAKLKACNNKPKKRVKEDKYPKANADGSDSAQTGEQKRPKAKRSSSPPPLRVMAPAAAAEELAPLSAAGRLTDAMCTTAVPETPLPADTELPPNEPTAEPKGARVANAKVDTFVAPVTVEAMPPSPTPKAAPPHATPKAVTPAPVVNQDNCLLDLIIAGEAVPAVPRKE